VVELDEVSGLNIEVENKINGSIVRKRRSRHHRPMLALTDLVDVGLLVEGESCIYFGRYTTGYDSQNLLSELDELIVEFM